MKPKVHREIEHKCMTPVKQHKVGRVTKVKQSELFRSLKLYREIDKQIGEWGTPFFLLPPIILWVTKSFSFVLLLDVDPSYLDLDPPSELVIYV